MDLHPTYLIAGERVGLRPLTTADVPALLAYRSRGDVCRWVPFEPQDAAELTARVAGMWSRTALDEEGQALTLGVELQATGELLGDVVLFWHSREHRTGEIGYVLDPERSGHGYATEAARLLLRVGFEDLGLHRIAARIDARNNGSAAVARRLGMRQEAHLRQNEWFKGAWSDELVFAMLEHEWGQRAATGR